MEVWREELYHHGILGMKWGVRRFQNKDGSLTDAGRKRYDVNKERDRKKIEKEYSKYTKKSGHKTGLHVDKAFKKASEEADSKMLNDKEFFKELGRKYGDRLYTKEDFRREYGDRWNKIAKSTFNKELNDFSKSDKNYQKAKALCNEYGMKKWSEIAKYDADLDKDIDYWRLLGAGGY